MRPLTQNTRRSPIQLSICIAAAAIVGILCSASAQGQFLQIPSLQVQLRVPSDWHIIDTVHSRGVTIGPRGRGANWTLDVLAWKPTASDLSAESAAMAHERVLAVRLEYERESLAQFTTADGGVAALVRGRVATDDGNRHAVLFAAYVVQRTYFIVGTFCAPDEVGTLRDEFFDEAIHSFSTLGTPSPSGSQPVHTIPPSPPVAATTDAASSPPGAPTTDTEPSGPVRTVPPSPPVTPTEDTAPPEPLGDLTPYRHPLGFTMQIPSGWDVTIEGGCILARSAEDSDSPVAAIWPLIRSAGGDIGQRAIAAQRALAARLGTRWRNENMRHPSGPYPTTVSQGSLTLAGKPFSAVAIFTASGDIDLLQAALFPRGSAQGWRLLLAKTLGSFEWPGLWIASSSNTDGRWSGDDGALICDDAIPFGWHITGGVQLYNGVPAIAIQGTHAVSGAGFVWRQPRVPAFKSLTPDLVASGWRKGASFPPRQGSDPLLLAKRPGVAEACRDELLSRGLEEITSSASSARAAGLLDGARGVQTKANSADAKACCLYALADAPGRFGDDCWMSAFLYFGGPPGQYQTAGAVLRGLIENLRIDPTWAATARQRDELKALLDGAGQAARELPGGSTEPQDAGDLEPLLLRVVSAGTEAARKTEIPGQLSRLWQQAATAPGAQRYLPELLSE